MPNRRPLRLPALADDPYLAPYRARIEARKRRVQDMTKRLTGGRVSLMDFASGHEYFGLHRDRDGWVFREWAPSASAVYLVGMFNDWKEQPEFALKRINAAGHWELRMSEDRINHCDLYKLRVHWAGGSGDRIPAFARRVVQDEQTKIFNAQVWNPPDPYRWKHPSSRQQPEALSVYEAHPGMAQERYGIGTYAEFRRNTLPRIVDAGYNTLQLMALAEHPYYGSFGYHVSNYFAASSRFGTPEELKELIDAAHGAGLLVIMDVIHSHAVSNEIEGLSRFDGTLYQYFHEGDRGRHMAWDSRCFDYGKPEVLHFLLSNCRFWLDEYRVDGFRFDGVTSMLYLHHGLGPGFNSYEDYFNHTVDEDAFAYLALANQVIHAVNPEAVTVAEDVSGMPGLAAPVEEGGCGFDFRLAMGVPDCWFKLVNDISDEHWNMDYLWRELTNRRADEKTISYVECHDQALVGGKSLIFELIDAPMYQYMRLSDDHMLVERGLAIHKMARLATVATASFGYLNFIGNEFGHPEWVDFPREGNNWSYHYARRQWSLRDDPNLKYHCLADFDKAMLELVNAHKFMGATHPECLHVHNDNKVLVSRRGNLMFCFNFHPSGSYTNYFVDVPAGRYELVLDTDEKRFGGQGRLTPHQAYSMAVWRGDNWVRNGIRLYLPARAALVLQRFD